MNEDRDGSSKGSIPGKGVPGLIAGDWNEIINSETLEGISAQATDGSKWVPQATLPTFNQHEGENCKRLGRKQIDSVCCIAPPRASTDAPFLTVDSVKALPHHNTYRHFYDHDAFVVKFTVSETYDGSKQADIDVDDESNAIPKQVRCAHMPLMLIVHVQTSREIC